MTAFRIDHTVLLRPSFVPAFPSSATGEELRDRFAANPVVVVVCMQADDPLASCFGGNKRAVFITLAVSGAVGINGRALSLLTPISRNVLMTLCPGSGEFRSRSGLIGDGSRSGIGFNGVASRQPWFL